jgi:small ligand-binding sensory domain FIST
MVQATGNRFTSALSSQPGWQDAVDEVCASARPEPTPPPDLAMLFFSIDHVADAELIAQRLSDRLECEKLIGCQGESIVGCGVEVEQEPALSLWLAWLPGVELDCMHLNFERTPDGGTILGWPDELMEGWDPSAVVLVVADPFSFPMELLLEQLNQDHPGVPVTGGMASGVATPGESRLVLGSRVMNAGAVACRLQGKQQTRTIVSQGCRPIGDHYVITSSEHNVIKELRGEPALVRLKEVFDSLPTRDQELVQQGLQLGRVVNEYQESFEQGDFLVRSVVGIDTENGSLTVADYMRPGNTVQFHVRDAETADAELVELLVGLKQDEQFHPSGALLFTCNGRGTRLFEVPHHDAGAIQQQLGDVPLAGFFAQGEVGPVGNQNFLHGFTASMILFAE